ncbi:Dihydrofolate reductase type 3 [Candidatus Promineifilum breve]|uniref:Dihydrofolate reductase n=1 Tax=Candidatus Promineifilum breve TaxID=1806508 RepID=A0A170PJE0_9CHLR|nr:dihydrofolate reductase [Candidatus Promineifilum breve]CUS05463.2 Dihydrofolate reductase type 3 [Candidatus Promineifilum breve]
MPRPRIAFVVAMDDNRLIGRDNALPWRLPDDMAWFREVTLGKPCIMGRKTYDSLPARFRPLPGRQNIVVTRNRDYAAPGAVVVHSVEDALAAAGAADEIIIVGGADLFRRLLPVAGRLYLTQVHGAVEGDVYFPAYDAAQWREVYRADHPADARHPFAFTWLILDRVAEG